MNEERTNKREIRLGPLKLDYGGRQQASQDNLTDLQGILDPYGACRRTEESGLPPDRRAGPAAEVSEGQLHTCLLYTSDAADEDSPV